MDYLKESLKSTLHVRKVCRIEVSENLENLASNAPNSITMNCLGRHDSVFMLNLFKLW